MNLQDIKCTACIGAGLIGSSWATLFAKNGYEVNIYDIDPTQLAESGKRIRAFLEVYVGEGYLSENDVEQILGRIHFCENIEEALSGVQLIQECSAEKLDVKKKLLEQIDALNQTALFCSSTSTLNISDIAANSAFPERCLGAHPYNPAHIMPYVELTRGIGTSGEAVDLARQFYESMGKKVVVLKKEKPGFIGNRLQGALNIQAFKIVIEDICDPEDVDTAVRWGLGIRWALLGPYLNGELNGGANGISDFLVKYYRNFPDEFVNQTAPEGVKRIKQARKEEIGGESIEEINAYRDRYLLKILRLLGEEV